MARFSERMTKGIFTRLSSDLLRNFEDRNHPYFFQRKRVVFCNIYAMKPNEPVRALVIEVEEAYVRLDK